MPIGAVGGAILGAGALGAVGSIIGGQEQASGQQAAANTQAGMFNTIVGQEQPFLQGGYGANSALQQLLGIGTPPPAVNGTTTFGGGRNGPQITLPNSALAGTGGTGTAPNNTGLPFGYLTQQFNPTTAQLENYPGYQFELQQGEQAIANQLGPTQGALSGATLKSLAGFAQGLASTDYGNYFNQFQQQQNNIFNRLSGLASLGQNAAANLGNSGTQLGTGIAQAQAAMGGSLGASYSGALNSLSSGATLATILGGGGGSGGGGFTLDPSVANWVPPTF